MVDARRPPAPHTKLVVTDSRAMEAHSRQAPATGPLVPSAHQSGGALLQLSPDRPHHGEVLPCATMPPLP
jgi:hypothetical protein